MYKVSVTTKEDIIKHREPVIYDYVRTVSITTARILLTDDRDHMINLRPDVITNISINPVNNEEALNE